MLDISAKIFKKWDFLGVIYCHWKSNEHLVPGLDGDTDLDVLVASVNKELCEQSLRDLDLLKCKSQFGSCYQGVDDWIGFDIVTGKQIHVHLHFQIVTGHTGMKEYSLPWTELALRTRVLDDNTNVYVMEPNLELLTLYTRIGLKASVKKKQQAKKGYYKVGEDVVKEIVWLKQRVNQEKLSALIDKYYSKDAHELSDIISAEKLTSKDFLRLIDITERAMDEYNRFGYMSRFYKYYYPIVLRVRSALKTKANINLITRKTPISGKGLVIAFIGQDGSGKSTVTADVEKWLTWKMDAKRFYLGSGEHYKSWQKTLLNDMPKNKNMIQMFLSAYLSLSMYLDLSKQVYNSIVAACKYASKGGIALFDRYPQDIYAGINDGPKIRANYMHKIKNGFVRAVANIYASKEEKNISRASAIMPDLVFKLMLSPEDSLKRKPEEFLEAIKKKHDIIKKLEFKGAKVYTIDATRPYRDELIQIKQIIWEHIHKS